MSGFAGNGQSRSWNQHLFLLQPFVCSAVTTCREPIFVATGNPQSFHQQVFLLLRRRVEATTTRQLRRQRHAPGGELHSAATTILFLLQPHIVFATADNKIWCHDGDHVFTTCEASYNRRDDGDVFFATTMSCRSYNHDEMKSWKAGCLGPATSGCYCDKR